MSEGNGTCYIYNMNDQPVTITLNSAPAQKLEAKGGAEASSGGIPYQPNFNKAPRTSNPQPYQEYQLGGNQNESKNTLDYYLSDDKGDTRHFVVELTQNTLHLNLDCELYLYYEHVVLSYQGDSQVISQKSDS